MDYDKFEDYWRNKQPLCKEFETVGFNIYHSGGGCSALQKQLENGEIYFITCDDDASIPTPEYPTTHLGHYTNDESFCDGVELEDSKEFSTVEECLAYVKELK